MKTKYYTTTSGLAATRQRLGLSQSAIALELGISRSMVNMVERGERSLSSETLIKLAGLEISLAVLDNQSTTRTPHPSEAFTPFDRDVLEACEDNEQRCRHRANMASYRLDKMIEDYENERRVVDCYDQLAAGGYAWTQEPSFKARHYRALDKMRRCGIHAQTILRNRVALLNAEAELSKSVQQKFQPCE